MNRTLLPIALLLTCASTYCLTHTTDAFAEPVPDNKPVITDTSTQGQSRALLIGVSNYPYLDPTFNLVGPRNDVLLMSKVLQGTGIAPDNISLLTENVKGAKTPTKANIEHAVQKLLDESAPGDMVYLHFSGHGSQQPSLDLETEIDGLDETFLPADTKQWNNSIRSVENAITDDEVSQWLSQFKTKGVFVWLVFDSCHSGTMTRSQWRSRKVQPNLLGVPSLRTTSSDTEPSVFISSKKQKGDARHVSFFAAQTNEETPEMALPKRSDDAKAYGLFTYQIAQALRHAPGSTYQQIAQLVMQSYSAQMWFGSRPMFAGDGLNTTIFQSETATRPTQWQISRSEQGYEIPVGFLDNIGPGTQFSILRSPTDPDSKAIRAADIASSSALTSLLDIPDSNSLPTTAIARLSHSSFQPKLAVAWIKNPSLSDQQNDSIYESMMAKTSANVLWKVNSEPADLRLFPSKDALYLLTDGEPLPSADSLHKYHKIDQNQDQLASAIATIAKARNLMALGTQIGSDSLDVSLRVQRQDGQVESFDGTNTPQLKTGDRLSLIVANYLEQPLDITVLFVGSDYSVVTAFPRKGQFNRFMEEEEKIIKLGTINSETTGFERIIVIATQANRTATPSNFAFLAQSGIPQARSSFNEAAMLLMQAGFGVGARGSMPITESLKSQLDIKTLTWQTVPH